ncbi:MAG: alpha/beta hydrolase [Chitinophagales bacterium]|nr:alpha/beta hydrolase [Chitinophagales bacterium]
MVKNIIVLFFLTIFLGCTITNPKVNFLHPVPIENTSSRTWISGWISVPENRTENSSNLIKLPFIYSKAPDSLRKMNVPVLIMSGGPGNSSLHMANGVVNTAWGEKRDVFVFEQRGTRYAEPSLTCPEVDSLRIYGLVNGLWGDSLRQLKMQGVQACYKRLVSQNIDLNGYNTLETVEDIEALRKVLKIDKMILYGMSYSCNLMTAYAQTYPKNTAALILDSPLPHQVNYDEEAYRNIDSILIRITDYYSGSEQFYRQWKNYLHSVQDSVFEVSINGKSFRYTKNELIDIVLFKMSSHSSLKEVTTSIQNITQGNHQGIAEVINYYLEPSGQALGMRYSLWLSEEIAEEKINVINQQKNLYSWLYDYQANDVSFEMGDVWKVNSLYLMRKWPNSIYDGSVLILSGQFDPWTPEWYGITASQYLPNSKHIIYPEHSHLPGFSEKGIEDINEFINQIDKGVQHRLKRQ